MPQEFAPGLFVQINRVQVGYLFYFTVYIGMLFICGWGPSDVKIRS